MIGILVSLCVGELRHFFLGKKRCWGDVEVITDGKRNWRSKSLVPSLESREWISGNDEESESVWDASRCACCGGVVVVQNILVIDRLSWVEMWADEGLEVETGIVERIVEVFWWSGEFMKWKISTPAVVGDDAESGERKDGEISGNLGICLLEEEVGGWTIDDSERWIQDVEVKADGEAPVEKELALVYLSDVMIGSGAEFWGKCGYIRVGGKLEWMSNRWWIRKGWKTSWMSRISVRAIKKSVCGHWY